MFSNLCLASEAVEGERRVHSVDFLDLAITTFRCEKSDTDVDFTVIFILIKKNFFDVNFTYSRRMVSASNSINSIADIRRSNIYVYACDPEFVIFHPNFSKD